MIYSRFALFKIHNIRIFRFLWNSKELVYCFCKRSVVACCVYFLELPSLEQFETEQYSFYNASVANFESKIGKYDYDVDITNLRVVSFRNSFNKTKIQTISRMIFTNDNIKMYQMNYNPLYHYYRSWLLCVELTLIIVCCILYGVIILGQ